MITTVTTVEFREHRAYHWEHIADDWITVTDGDTPLWQFKRGSLLIFKNEQLPRLDWTAFKRGRVGDNLALLRAHSVVVLQLRKVDTFLVRLPQ